MPDSKFPKVFTKCPGCGSEETILVEAWKETHGGEIEKDRLILQTVMPTMLFDPGDILKPMESALIENRQGCAKCGLVYTGRADIVPVPTDKLRLS